METQIFTVAEVAERFKVKDQTVRTWLMRGELQSFKIGNNVRITEASIQLFLEDSSKPKNIIKG